MTFIVNGAEWNFAGMTPEHVEALIDRVLDFVTISADRGELVLIGDDLQSRPMYNEYTLWQLFGEESPLQLSMEIGQELAAWLQRAQFYADVLEWPSGVEDAMISVGGAPTAQNEDLAWIHHGLRSGRPMACVTLGSDYVTNSTSAAGSVEMHVVSSEVGRRRFWQAAIKIEGDSLVSLVNFASHAYPDLYFVDGVLSDADHLAGGYLASRQRVQSALALLDAWGYWAFTQPGPAIAPTDIVPSTAGKHPNNQLIEHRFNGFGLMAAPEKPDVRADRSSREAREIVIGGRALYCEWHIKLEPHRNRIHFHAPVLESGNKVVIGVIHEHLPLPH